MVVQIYGEWNYFYKNNLFKKKGGYRKSKKKPNKLIRVTSKKSIMKKGWKIVILILKTIVQTVESIFGKKNEPSN